MTAPPPSVASASAARPSSGRSEPASPPSPALPPERVAMLCNGTERYGIGTIEKLYAKGAPGLSFVCQSEGPMLDWLRGHGHRVDLVPGLGTFVAYGSLATLLRMPRALAQARRDARRLDALLRPRGIEIVHAHWLPQQIVAGWMRRLGYLSVWQINNNMNRRRLKGLGVTLNHRLARWGADLLLPASDFIAENWQGCGVPMRTVRNAAEAIFAGPNVLPPSPVRCLIAGRLEAVKGHHLAIEAVLRARRAGLDVELDCFGGPLEGSAYAEDLRRTVRAAGAEQAIRLHGFDPTVRRRHQDYHLALHCRIDAEPCSLWVCETMVDGVPIIASATGGTPELVADGVSGLLFTPGDVDDLARKLVELAGDPARLAEMRRMAFQRGAEHFRLERFIAETFAGYHTLERGGHQRVR